MPTLESFQGSSLVPDVLGQFGRGVQLGGQIQQQRLLRQQAEAAQAEQAQLQQLLGQLGGGGFVEQQPEFRLPAGATPPITPIQPQLGGQIPTTPGFAPPSVSGQAQARQRLAIQFPKMASEIAAAQKAQFEASNLPTKNRIESVVKAAAELKGLDAAQQIRTLEARRGRLISQGLPTNDTDEHLALLNAGRFDDANALTDQAIQLGERIGVLKQVDGAQKLTTLQQNIEATGLKPGTPEFQAALQDKLFGVDGGVSEVQSSKILPGGLVQFIRKDGTVEVVQPEEANLKLIREAEIRGAELQGLRAGERGAAAETIKIGIDSFKSLRLARKNIANMNEGIRLLQEGAKTGAIQGRLPSIRAASVKLENLQNRLGLDVIGGTTFGALSESELAFALATALPTRLNEDELLKWMIEKRDAQMKVAANLEEAALFLGTPGNTVRDFIELKRQERAAKTEQEAPLSPEEQTELDALRLEAGR